MMKPITLLTDFGTAYTAAMKGKILLINPDARIVEISHEVSPHNLREGAFLLRSVVRHFPPAIHLAVIDPGVGTPRKGIIIKAKDSYFVGPDNGLLIPAASFLGEPKVWEIKRRFGEISYTFHGRDIFAPVAAHLSLGEKPEDFGVPLEKFVRLDIEDYEVSGDVIKGEVIYIDDFGNVVTNVPYEKAKEILSYGDNVSLYGRIMPFCRTYGEVQLHHPLVVVGSHGSLEISINQGNASQFFNIKTGDKVMIKVL